MVVNPGTPLAQKIGSPGVHTFCSVCYPRFVRVVCAACTMECATPCRLIHGFGYICWGCALCLRYLTHTPERLRQVGLANYDCASPGIYRPSNEEIVWLEIAAERHCREAYSFDV